MTPARAGGALAGRRVLVTRARAQAEKTAASIRARGGEPVLLPSIEIHPPPDVRALVAALDAARGGQFRWVAFTSENGVVWTWNALAGAGEAGDAGEPGGTGQPVFGGARVAAIGPGTAAALEQRGVRPDVVATDSKGEGLARAMLDAMAAGDSLLLFRARVAREVFPEALRAAGHPVEVVAAYETRAAAGPEAACVFDELAGGVIDAVTFTSASTVESFVALAGGEDRAEALLRRTLVASIGPITSLALEAHGLRVDATASVSTLEGLLDALEARFQASPREI